MGMERLCGNTLQWFQCTSLSRSTPWKISSILQNDTPMSVKRFQRKHSLWPLFLEPQAVFQVQQSISNAWMGPKWTTDKNYFLIIRWIFIRRNCRTSSSRDRSLWWQSSSTKERTSFKGHRSRNYNNIIFERWGYYLNKEIFQPSKLFHGFYKLCMGICISHVKDWFFFDYFTSERSERNTHYRYKQVFGESNGYLIVHQLGWLLAINVLMGWNSKLLWLVVHHGDLYG